MSAAGEEPRADDEELLSEDELAAERTEAGR